MIIKVCSFDGDIDVFSMHWERMLTSDIEHIGMPADIDLLGDVG